MINKKASILPDTTVKVILVVIAFAIIMGFIGFLFYYFYFGNSFVDEEICHLSVVVRSSFDFGRISLGSVFPLRCKTEKVCFTMEGDCEEAFGSATKKYKIREVELGKDIEKAKTKVKDEIAEMMVGCHSMLGEGLLKFMPSTVKPGVNYGVVCSRFAFDEMSAEKIDKISYGELYEHLQLKKTYQGQSYLSYLYPYWINWRISKQIFEKIKSDEKAHEELKEAEFDDWGINPSFEKGYAVVAQMNPRNVLPTVIGAGGVPLGIVVTGVGAVFAATGIGAPLGVGMMVSGIAITGGSGAAIWYDSTSDEKSKYSPPNIYPFIPKELRESGIYFVNAP